MKNAEVAERLLEIADLLDVLGERFRPEAYRRAARSVESLVESVDEVAARGELQQLPGVGAAIDEKIRELLRTGSIDYLERLRQGVPPGLRELLRLPGLGPKTARRFWTEFGIEGPRELADAIAAGRLRGAKGFGERKISQLRTALEVAAVAPPAARVPLELAYPLAHALVAALRDGAPVREVAVAGSFRRGRETVGDLDLLATSDTPEEVFDVFSALPQVREVRLRGPTKETVLLTGGLQVDLRVVEPAAFGAALQYFTGSKEHNVRLRSLARERGLKINEYGVFRGATRVGGRTEQELYGLLGLPWIPPELREDRGEIDLAREHRLPKLIEAGDLRGELHLHLPPPAGPRELAAVVAEARRRSLAYVGVVVAEYDGEGVTRPLPRPMRERLARASGPHLRLLAVAEGEGAEPPDGISALGVDYLVARPWAGARTTDRPTDLPCLVVAHLRGREGAEAETALTIAKASRAALEVGPGPDRADPSLARAAREQRIPLSLPTGLGEPPERPTQEVALGFARRAGTERSEVRNARELGGLRRATSRRRR